MSDETKYNEDPNLYTELYVCGLFTLPDLESVIRRDVGRAKGGGAIESEHLAVDIFKDDGPTFPCDSSSWRVEVVPALGLATETFVNLVRNLVIAIQAAGYTVVCASSLEDQIMAGQTPRTRTPGK